MLNEFQNEIIAAIVVLCLLVAFVLIRRNKSAQVTDSEPVVETEETVEEVVEDEIPQTQETPQREEIPEIKEEIEKVVLSAEAPKEPQGSEEGDFGAEPEVENSEHRRKNDATIQKRNVPKHGKITKQHFSEFSGQRVLVAEDNIINQKVINGLLAGSGIEIVMADDGQIALDILEKDSDFLLVLMDAHMPRVDGFEATRAIRSNPKYDHILVVALSGDTASDDIAKMREAGMSEQLEKPLRMDSLYDILYAYTGQESKEENSDYLEVVMTKALNGEKGLATCGGDEEFYHEILDEFVSTYENSTDKLGELLRSEQLAEADKMLLDIIGVTANIGADQLNVIATDIKSALTDTQEKSYLTLTEQYKAHIENLIQDIKEYR